jgi:hypothetical protein
MSAFETFANNAEVNAKEKPAFFKNRQNIALNAKIDATKKK